MERIEIIGNLTRDPECRVTNGGKPVCSFDVAVNRRVGGKDEPRYYNVSAFEALGDVCAQYLKKGRKVLVSGRPDAQAWIARSGEARGAIRILANSVEFLSGSERNEAPAAKKEDAEGFTPADEADDELPF